MTENEMTAAETPRKTPIHLWIIGVLALLWNAMGAFDYLATQLEAEFYMNQFSEEQLAYFSSIPAWAVSGWAIAVWSALLGSIGLLMRKKWALWTFVVSLAGMLVSSIYTYGLSNGAEMMGTGGLIFSIVIWGIGIFLVFYARSQVSRGVLT